MKKTKTVPKEYSILIGGAAGQGSRMAGLVIAKIFNRMGYNIFIHEDYQSLIKGGHNFSQIRASSKKILSHKDEADFILALNEDTIKKHKEKLSKNGTIVFNQDKISFEGGVGVKIETIAKESGGLSIMSNTALIAAFAKIAGIDWRTLEDVLKKEITKGVEKNLEIAKKAYASVESLAKIEKIKNKPKPLLTGNEATALGAAKAGLENYFAYPMTPATGILHYLAGNARELNMAASQLENEISVINAGIGSAFAGKRTMVGTSGGGFALMTEGVSLAAMSETPILIVNSQRSGPATGVPTYGGQSDLLFSLSSGHGDLLRFVAAPGDAEESFYWAGKLLNMAWKYQSPAILLTDKDVSESTFSFDEKILNKVKKEKFSEWSGKGEYKRYLNKANGISPMAFPGQPGAIVKGTSYEHDEYGISTEETADIVKMQEKRLRKFEAMQNEIDKMKEAIEISGNLKSKKAVICWGSAKGAVKEAAEDLGFKVIRPIVIQPFPERQIYEALKGVSKIISIELNSTGQMEYVLNGCGIEADQRILKYDMRPFTAEELKIQLKKA
ncbi:MAG: 2-oxoacid:acceptor oxidoreductase subunit alpha [Candidatus Paceibacterota bacterium]|jgi:2-oxoglutarate ferredoxin oxidoreductase subunit alpha